MNLHLTTRNRIPILLSLAIVSACLCLSCVGLSDASHGPSTNAKWQARPGGAKFLRAAFVTSSIGYAVVPHDSRVEVRRSNDGGENWHSVVFISDVNVVDLDFYNVAIGFIVIETTDPERKVKILRTTDEAVSWLPVFESDSLEINNLTLDRKKGMEAVAVGSEIDLSRPAYLSNRSGPVLLVTDDQGATWREDSRSVLGIVDKNEALASAMMSVQFGCVVLTSHGRVIARPTQDGTWRLILDRKPGTLSYYPLGAFSDGDLWIAGGTGAIEGIRSSIGVFDGSWSHRDLKDWYIADAISIGEEGIMVNAKLGKDGNMRRSGIYFSSDRGRNWSVVHEVEDASVTFAPLARVSDERILGGTGFVIQRKRN